MKALALACACLMVPFTPLQAADPLQGSIRLQTEVGHDAVESQQQVNQLYDEKQRLLEEYRSINSELQSLQQYDNHLQKMMSAQEQKIISQKQQMDEIDVTHRDVVPLMARMVETLEQFIALDVPFLIDERRERVANLKDLLDKPDASVAEKYRRVMEAYQVETEYGRTMEAYPDSLQLDGQEKTVDFLKVGRIGLIYRSLNGDEMGLWDQPSRSWQPLAKDYRRSLAQGFRMAKKQLTPDLLKLLVPAPENL
ncbi:MAG: DUF3450 domain-containing protein [Gammaproteobacteria bacterium]|nr:DUF3450 domain-containing protein [Gammaproteobacteria bacterium]